MSQILKAMIVIFALSLHMLDAPAFAQPSQQDCGPYFDAASESNQKIPGVLAERLLLYPEAIPCLAMVIKVTNRDIGPRGLSESATSRLLTATAALRTIMTRGLLSSDQSGPDSKSLNDFIGQFHAVEDLDVASALSYGARSNGYNLRANSVLILGNIVDNKIVCVVLTHLNDPTLLNSPGGVSGRANLLGVVSVVAPYAYKENFDNITNTVRTIRSSADVDIKLMPILDNIETRLGSQTPTSNKNVTMPEASRKDCARYVSNFEPKIPLVENVRY